MKSVCSNVHESRKMSSNLHPSLLQPAADPAASPVLRLSERTNQGHSALSAASTASKASSTSTSAATEAGFGAGTKRKSNDMSSVGSEDSCVDLLDENEVRKSAAGKVVRRRFALACRSVTLVSCLIYHSAHALTE